MASRVWFITGCSGGFGKELALQVLSRGDKVIATARDVSKLTLLEAAGADTLSLDVTADPDTIKRVAETAHQIHGRIDILVNNAGILMDGAIEETRYGHLSGLSSLPMFRDTQEEKALTLVRT
jgi:NAD(P)-dependent dehydrogenase (short-subunit alcohol dehydrogenase family)